MGGGENGRVRKSKIARAGAGIVGKLSAKFDIPADVLPGGWRAELLSGREISVNGCRRILLYTENEIKLLLPGCIMTVRGEGLAFICYGEKSVSIGGSIAAVETERAV